MKIGYKEYSFKLSFNFIIEFLVALYAFLRLSPYFTWTTFMGGRFSSLDRYVFILLLCFYIVYMSFYKGLKHFTISLKDGAFGGIAVLIGFVLMGICGLQFKGLLSTEWIIYIYLCLYLFLPENMKVSAYKYYLTIFVITLIPSLLFYMMDICKIGTMIPYTFLESVESIKSTRGLAYIHRPFSVQLCQTAYVNNILFKMRFCGIYDEAGKVGTIIALFLVSQGFKLKGNWKNIVLIIAGICSFSLAFYMLVIVYFILYNLSQMKFKNVLILMILPIVYILFMNMSFENEILEQLQSRFLITSTGLSGDNRTNQKFDRIFENYLHSDIFTLMFGFGMGVIQEIQREGLIDGSSYKCYIYNYGIVGFGLTIIWILMYAWNKFKIRLSKIFSEQKKMQIIILAIVYIINMYQRPSTFHPSFMLILLGGMAYLNKFYEK